MADEFTEVTSEGWLSRVGGAIKGVLIGVVLFIAGFPVLFWGEGRAVREAKTIEEGQAGVVDVAADKADPANDGKLVHLTGEARTAETLKDDQFGISLVACKLRRTVEMYQWVEKKESTKEKKLGGKEETTTKYKYVKEWQESLSDSSQFKDPANHANPAQMQFRQNQWSAGNVTAGAFTLSSGLVAQMSQYAPLPLGQEDVAKLPADLKSRVQVQGLEFYFAAKPAAGTTAPAPGPEAASAPAAAGSSGEPQIGDVRVKFEVVKGGPVSLIAKQKGSGFEAYVAKTGKTIEMLSSGQVSAAEMFSQRAKTNVLFTWLIRLGGFLLMFIGLSMVFRPLSVVADVLPILGDIVGMGTGLLAFVIALPLSLLTIAVGWVVYRPVVGIILLVVAGGVVYLGHRMLKARKAARQQAAGPVVVPLAAAKAKESSQP